MQPHPPSVRRALGRALLKSLVQTAILVAGSLLLAGADPRLGILFGLAGSGFLMIRAYRKESPLSAATCLLPAVCSLLCVAIQAASLKVRTSGAPPGVGLPIGLVLGYFSGRGQKVFVRKNRVYARKQGLYLIVWFLAVVLTQGFALFGLRRYTGWGLTGGFFSAAMSLAASLAIFGKYRSERAHLAAGAAVRMGAVLAILGSGAALWQFQGRAIAQIIPMEAPSQGFQSCVDEGNRIFEEARTNVRVTFETPPSNSELQAAVDAAMQQKVKYGAELDGTYHDRKCGPARVQNSGVRGFHFPETAGQQTRNFILLFVDVEQTCDAIVEIANPAYRHQIPYLTDEMIAAQRARDQALFDEVRRTNAHEDAAGLNFVIPRQLHLREFWILFLHARWSMGDSALPGYDFKPVYQASNPTSADNAFGTAAERENALAIWKQKFGLQDGIVWHGGTVQTFTAVTEPEQSDEGHNPIRSISLLGVRAGFDFRDSEYASALFIALAMIAMTLGLNLSAALAVAEEALAQELTADGIVGGPAEHHRPAPPPPPPVQNQPPLYDPETGELLPAANRQNGGRPGQVFYKGEWMDRAEAERRFVEWERQLEADRQKWFDDWTRRGQAETRDRLQKDGQVYVPAGDAWRRPPEMNRVQAPPEDPHARDFEFQGGILIPNVSQPGIDARYDQLDRTERAALDEYARLKQQRDAARADGDDWLSAQYDRLMKDARQQVGDVRRLKDELQAGTRNVDEGVDKVTMGEAAADLLQDVGRAGDAVFQGTVDKAQDIAETAGKMWRGEPAFEDTEFAEGVKRAIQARNRLQGDMDADRATDAEHGETLEQFRSLRQQVAEARRNGDLELEASLRQQAEPLAKRLLQLEGKGDRLREEIRQWQLEGAKANLRIYGKTAGLWVSGLDSVHSAADLAGLIQDWRARTGLRLEDLDPRTERERLLDMAHGWRMQDGREKIFRWQCASAVGDEKEFRETTFGILEDPYAKLQMKNAPLKTQQAFEAVAEKYRNEPLQRKIAETLNREQVAPNKGRFEVWEGEQHRPVEPRDFSPVRGTKGSIGPGQDLDLQHPQIVEYEDVSAPKIPGRRYLPVGEGDSLRARVVGEDELQKISDEAARSLGMDPVKQEIHMVGSARGSTHPEAFPMRREASTRTMYDADHIATFGDKEGRIAAALTDLKVQHSGPPGSAGRITFGARAAMKDEIRVTEPLLEAHPKAALPAQFDPDTLSTMYSMGTGKMPPGMGNATLRAGTGMEAEQAFRALNVQQEAIIKLDPAHPAPPDFHRAVHGPATPIPEMKPLATQTGKATEDIARVEGWASQVERKETPDYGTHTVSENAGSKSWAEFDAKHGGSPDVQLPRGQDAAPDVQAYFGKLGPRMVQVDSEVRDAWRLAEGASAGGWERFERVLNDKVESGKLLPQDFNTWLEQMERLRSGAPPPVAGATARPQDFD